MPARLELVTDEFSYSLTVSLVQQGPAIYGDSLCIMYNTYFIMYCSELERAKHPFCHITYDAFNDVLIEGTWYRTMIEYSIAINLHPLYNTKPVTGRA